jgi:hypothetical protein
MEVNALQEKIIQLLVFLLTTQHIFRLNFLLSTPHGCICNSSGPLYICMFSQRQYYFAEGKDLAI